MNVEDKVGYAGRLDPLASGVLILMIGETCKRRDEFQKLRKIYEFKVLFGVTTDSLDPMGMISDKGVESLTVSTEDISDVVNSMVGKLEIRLPLYCSHSIDGEPMFKLAKDGSISDSDRPIKEIEIFNSKLLNVSEVNLNEQSEYFIKIISGVNGDFRQDEIIGKWREYKTSDNKLQVATIRMEVSSGSYIRSISELIGEKLGYKALAFDIDRMSVGNFTIDRSLEL